MCPNRNFNPGDTPPPRGLNPVIDENIERARNRVRVKLAEKGVLLGEIYKDEDEKEFFTVMECPRLNYVFGDKKVEVKIIEVDVTGRCTVEVIKNGNKKEFGYLILLPKLEVIKK